MAVMADENVPPETPPRILWAVVLVPRLSGGEWALRVLLARKALMSDGIESYPH